MLNMQRFQSQNTELKLIIEKVNIFKQYLKNKFPDGLVPFFEVKYFIENESKNKNNFCKYSNIIESHLNNYINSRYKDKSCLNHNTLLSYQRNLINNDTKFTNDNINNLSDLIEKPSYIQSNLFKIDNQNKNNLSNSNNFIFQNDKQNKIPNISIIPFQNDTQNNLYIINDTSFQNGYQTNLTNINNYTFHNFEHNNLSNLSISFPNNTYDISIHNKYF